MSLAKDTYIVDTGATQTPSEKSKNDSLGAVGVGEVESEQVYKYEEGRKIGITSAVFLIMNKMVGTGIFSTPSGIFIASGSVGVSLILWVVGGIMTFAGLSVYLEFGLALPFSGGEKNYLERVYRKPRFMMSCVFLFQMVLLGFSSGNALAFGRYVLFSSGSTIADGWIARGIAIACITTAVLIHGILPVWGMRLINVLGIVKVFVLLFIVFSGFAALAGRRLVPDPQNFTGNTFKTDDTWSSGGPQAYATAMLRIVYSYKGWENANYVVGEMKRPKRTLAIAAPLAVGMVTVLYVLANVAYFSAISKEEMATSEVLTAGLFFRNVFGNSAGARALPALVAISNFGNILAVTFAHSRINQEFAKSGLMPWNKFWASNKPFNSPAAGLFLHWFVTVIVLLAPPAGTAYNFIVDLNTYPVVITSFIVTLGLLWLHYRPSEKWSSPWHTYLPITLIFLISNGLLIALPWVPPATGEKLDYPFFVFPLVGLAVLGGGVVYWVFWAKIIPRIGGYRIQGERIVLEDGTEVVQYHKVKVSGGF